MKITKFGHCCLLIEENKTRILTDPGAFTTLQNEEMNIHAVLITHEHADHLHIPSVKIILDNNPKVTILCNKDVGELLAKESVPFTCIEDGQKVTIKNITIEASGSAHAIIDPSIEGIMNTGFFIGERFFYPGDAFHNPKRAVDILALPVSAPWMKFSEAIAYAKEIQPSVCIPVHDGILLYPGMMAAQYKKVLGAADISFVELAIDTPVEL